MFKHLRYLWESFTYFIRYGFNRKRIRSAIAAIVVFTTVYTLIMPAIALEQKNASDMAGLDLPGQVLHEYACALEAHKHTDDCYKKKAVYDADGNKTGTKKVLNCGKADWIVHTHDENCYQDGVLVCTLPEHAEHVHTDACYSTKKKLICDLPEGEEHTHTDACYTEERILTCGESALHRHTVDCYQKGPNGESPVDMGWVSVAFDEYGNEIISGDPKHLICGQLELLAHQHSDACFIDVEVPAEEQFSEMPAEESVDQISEMPAEDISGEFTDPLTEEIQGEISEQQVDEFSGELAEQPMEGEIILDESVQEYDAEENALLQEEVAPEPDPNQLEDIEVVTDADAAEDADKTDQNDESDSAEENENRDVAEQDNETEIVTPAGERTIGVEGAPYSIHVSWPEESGISEGAEIRATAITEKRADYDAYRERALAAVDNYTTEEKCRAEEMPGLFDLTIYNADGEEIQPKAPLSVSIDLANAIANDATGVYAVHFPGTGADTVMSAISGNPIVRAAQIAGELISGTGPEVIETNEVDGEVQFETGSEAQLMASGEAQPQADGSKDAQPDLDAEGDVQHQSNADDNAQSTASGGEQLTTKNNTQPQTDAAGEAQPKAGSTGDMQSETDQEVQFEAESLSVYAIVYTVDFWYEVDGKMYEYSIEGGSTIGLGELLPILGVVQDDPDTEENEINDFVENIEKAAFSDESLVKVVYIENDTTAGGLKEQLGLVSEYSGALSEEQIAELNAKELKAGDWALMSLKAFDTEESLTVTMKTGEVFNVKVTDAKDPLGLDGQTYALLTNKVLNGNTTTHTLQANVHTTRDSRGYYLEAKTINKNDGTQYALNSYDGLEYVSADATAWTFEYNSPEEAYYVSYNGQYLYIDPNITNKSGSQDHSLNLVSDKNIADKGTLIKITTDGNGNYYLGNSKGTLLWDYGNGYWLSNPDASDENESKENNAAVRLCLPENPTSNASHKATMISVQDTQPGQRLVIYQRVLQPDNTYKNYAINGNGQLVEVFPSSDSVYWKGDQSVEWTMVDLGNGYYTLKNTITDTYLCPKGGETPTIIHQESDFADRNELSITLPGKGANGNPYTSLISCWDYTNNVTEGLKVTRDGNSATLSSVLSFDAQQFYFASRDPIVTGQLTTVDTVRNEDHGIKMTMFDFDGKISGARMTYQTEIMGGQTWAQGRLQQGIMGRTLTDGFPISTITGESYSKVFRNGPSSGDDQYIIKSQKEADHLFIQSVYDSTGFFHYSSFENFARFNETTGDFTVYDQIGTPACLNSDWNAAYQNRGNFMPFNDLDVTSSKYHTYNNQTVYGNWYQSGNSDPLPDDDPRKGERLYMMEGVQKTQAGQTDNNNRTYNNLDYFFGMIMEAKFMQGKDGLTDRGDPMRYEFNGDDDLYVYVDNVLLLDIGGVHDAFRGYIDFSTGDIEVYPATFQSKDMFLGQKTTIKRQYWEAGQFPNGDPWDHNMYPYDCDRANEFFDGETFRDYSTHDFKMFYMERGAGASNLQIDFNLMTLTDSQFRVKKEMPETDNGGEIQQDYADAAFFYEAWVKEENDADYHKVTRAYLESLTTLQDKTPRYQDGTEVEWKTEDPNETKFVVRPGQTAVFPAKDDSVRWYVKEVEPESGSSMLASYEISNSDQDISDPTGATANKELIKNRNIVTYQNRPNDDLVNELRITKKIIGTPYNANDKFEYRILLEGTDGKMQPYSEGPYYQLDKEGNYVYFEHGQRLTQTMPRVAEKTSTNGSVNNILDGDTIIIKGLLEGTDFYVYERTDTSYGNIAPNADPVEDKYVFVGTDMTGAFNRRTDNPQTYDFGHPVGHLFDTPVGLTGEEGMIKRYGISEYEQSVAAQGAILMGDDTDVTVKNKPYHPINITVEKKWPADSDDFHMASDLSNASTTFTLKRYKLDARHGTVNLTGILDTPPHTGADPVYHFRKDGQLIKTIAYSDLVKAADNHNTGTLQVTDLPIGDYNITIDDYVVGYTISSTVDPSTDTISVTEGNETNVTVTTSYQRQYGVMKIRKTLSGNYNSHMDDKFIYTVHGPDGFIFTVEKYVRDAVNGVITIDVESESGVPELPSGNYVISETVVNSNTSGSGLSGSHTPSSQGVYVSGGQTAYADFTGDYAKPLIPVTIHVGHDQNNGGPFSEDRTSVYYLPAGKTVTVTMSGKECQYYSEGVYAYGSTSACTDGSVRAYKNGATDPTGNNVTWITDTFTFTIPENVTNYDYYLKTKCNSVAWDPTIISAVVSNQGSRTMMRAALRSAPSAGPTKAGTSGGDIHNSVTDSSLPTLTPEEQAKEKFVIDDQWTMTVVLTKDDYKAYLGTDTTGTPVVTGDTTTGTNFWDALLSHESIVSEDENGNLYYYYIDSFSEEGITQRMKPSFDMDPDDSTKTLMASKNKNQKLSVSNELIRNGSLTITKEVNVNGQEVTDHTGPSPADGTYTFRLTKKNDNTFTERLITLTIQNGVTVTSTPITDLEAGEYTVTEEAPANGTTLTKIDGVPVSTSYSGDVTVTAGETANIKFTNNIGQTEITVKKVDADKAADAADRFLADAKFSLFDGDGHSVADIRTLIITDLVTGDAIIPDSNNEFIIPITGIKISGLPDGSYQLVEKKAPDGYVITNAVTTFTVSQGSVTAWSLNGTAGTAFEVPNPPGAVLPHTGGPGTKPLYLTGLLLMAIAGFGWLLRRRYRDL